MEKYGIAFENSLFQGKQIMSYSKGADIAEPEIGHSNIVDHSLWIFYKAIGPITVKPGSDMCKRWSCFSSLVTNDVTGRAAEFFK